MIDVLVSEVGPTVLPFSFGEDEYHTAGTYVQASCIMGKGDTPVEFSWTFHGREDSSMMGITTTRLGLSSILQISSISAAHSGNYTCTVRNNVGSQNHTAVLKVSGMTSTSAHQPTHYPVHYPPGYKHQEPLIITTRPVKNRT